LKNKFKELLVGEATVIPCYFLRKVAGAGAPIDDDGRSRVASLPF